MTPEERADAVAGKFVAFGQGRPTRVSLVMEISDAIRAAVDEEREAASAVAMAHANRWLNEPLRSDARADACVAVAAAIQARGKA